MMIKNGDTAMNDSFERIMQKLVAGLTVFTELIAVSLLWLACCLPVVTIAGASSAAYYTAVKVVRRKRESVLRAFLTSFRENWRQGIPASLVTAAAAALLLFYLLALGGMAGTGLRVAYLALTVLFLFLFLTLCAYYFPVLSRFRQGTLKGLQMSLTLAVAHPLRTLGAVAILCASVLLCWLCFPLLGILPGLYCWGVSYLLEPVLRKATDAASVTDEDPWYLE